MNPKEYLCFQETFNVVHCESQGKEVTSGGSHLLKAFVFVKVFMAWSDFDKLVDPMGLMHFEVQVDTIIRP